MSEAIFSSIKDVLTLLRPRLLSFRNGGVSRNRRRRRARYLLFGFMGLLFWGGSFILFYRVLNYFQALEDFGDILAYKLLSMCLITFFSLLIFSAILTSLSKLYLSKDLPLVHSFPVSRQSIFLSRWMEAAVDSSWMVLIYSLPIFLSYGIVYRAGVFYYLMVAADLLPFCLIASSLSALVVMTVAVLLPAGRIRSVFVFLGLLLFLLLLFSFRLMRPEKFAQPEAFVPALLYLKNLETTHSPLLPTTWFYDALRAVLSGSIGGGLFHTALLWSCSAALIYVNTWVSGAIYFGGLSKAQTVSGGFTRVSGLASKGYAVLSHLPSGAARAFVIKEVKTFLRDQTQWSQIFLVLALIIIYLYNFSVLPLEKSAIKMEYLQNIISFLNMALAAFVLSAVSARFVFPAVSLEGDAFWIVKSSPVSIRTFLRIKFFIYFVPLLLLSEFLTVMTNILLKVSPFMMAISVLTTFLVVPGIISMGVGLGALYPDFHSENPVQSVTSLGGLIYMTLCVGFIAAVVVLEAGPVYSIFMTGIRGRNLSGVQWLWLLFSFGAVLFLCFAAFAIPMKRAERRLSRYEVGESVADGPVE